MKKVLVKVICGKRNIKKDKSILKSKRGSELAQTILITAIMIMLIAALFFPQIKGIFQNAMTQITTWFNTILGDISGT